MMRTIGRPCTLFSVLSLVLVVPPCLATAHAQELPGQVSAVPLESGTPIEREVGAGDVHAYQVTLDQGGFLRAIVEQRGVDVVVTVIGPGGEKIAEVDGPTGAEGGETIEVTATTSGSYRLEIRPWEEEGVEPQQAGRYWIGIDQLLSATGYAEHLAAERSKLEAVKLWLADHAIPLRTVEPGHGFEDMQPLKEMVGDAHVVALGEATHGTREFFQLKHRMLEFLVSEMGFTVFGIEATMPEAFDINHYVLTGEGDPAKALAGLYFWIWNTEEVLDLIEWMRRYNEDPRHSRKVKFYGFDLQFSPRAVKVTLDYLRAVDPGEARTAERSLAELANPYTAWKFVTQPKEQQEAAASAIRSVLHGLDEHRSEYISRTDSTAWVLARQHAEIVAQHIERMSRLGTPDGNIVRDSAMAQNIRWILEHEGPDTKMVVWAHNLHVSTASGRMAAYLREALSGDLVVFGFAFNQGSFQAIEPMPSASGLRSFTVEPAPEGSLDATLADAGLRVAAIDLRRLPRDGPVAEWWSIPRETRQLGATYREGGATLDWMAPRMVTRLYDALFFVDSTSSARSNPGGQLVGRALLSAPANLDFEDGELGEPPRAWFDGVIARLHNFDFDLTTTGDRPYQGERSAMIARSLGRHYGEVFGQLGQRIEAAPYRGKRVRLRAAVRTEVSGPDNQAYLWLHVTKGWAFPPSTAFYDDMSDRPITNRDWREFEIVGDVPADAEMIDYGMALVGEGRAWIDAVSVEVVQEE